MRVNKLLQKDSPYPHWEYLCTESNDRLRIIPERGGLISEWRCNGREVLYFDEERFRDNHKSIRGGIPILFPICGSLPNNVLPLPQGNFILKQHGFARDIKWELGLIDEKEGVSLTCLDSEQTRSMYPFSFSLGIEVVLVSGGMQILIKIENRDKVQMPYSFGLHPYFLVSKLQNISIQGLPEDCFNFLEMSNEKTYLQQERFSSGVDFLTSPNSTITLLDKLIGPRIELIHEEPMDLTVVWTDPPRSMICIEPWTTPRNGLISGDRKLLLEPGEIKHLKCKYRVF